MSSQTVAHARVLTHFSTCIDPRTRPVKYPLLEVIVLVFLALLCGEDGWEAMCEWGKDIEILRKFLPYKNGIPSPDTLRRVIERIDPKQFLSSFVAWAQEFKKNTGKQICIDGKTLAHAITEGGTALHLIAAWCEANRIVIGAARTAAKSNEIVGITELLNQLVLLQGDVVTIDAIGCQRSITASIVEQGADYVIAAKQNQPHLVDEIKNFFEQAVEAVDYAPVCRYGSFRQERGRSDTQEVWVCEDLDWLPQKAAWAGLSSVVMVRRSWCDKKGSHRETRYYISSLKASPERFAQLIRRHWSIENEFHWHLDVTFGEDASCISGKANENLRVARMMALEMLKAEKTTQRGLKAKARKCLRSDTYLQTVLLAGNF